MTVLAVTDTHALIWAATGTLKRLGRRSRTIYQRVSDGRAALYIPVVTLVEVGEAHRAGDFSLGVPFEAWLAALLRAGQYHVTELTAEIVERAQQLFAIPERADRLIAATASVLDCPLITRDASIARAADVECIW
jgi:PIN domain nuclease of toxin-antitoxin system